MLLAERFVSGGAVQLLLRSAPVATNRRIERVTLFSAKVGGVMGETKPQIDSQAAAAILSEHLGDAVADIRPLAGGNFSQAFAFVSAGVPYVVRFAHHRVGFDKDRFAARNFASASLPIPRVVSIERWGGGYWCISLRAAGTTLDTLPRAEKQALVPALITTLHHIHRVDVQGYEGYGDIDTDGRGRQSSWRDFILSLFDETRSGYWQEWRAVLAASCLEWNLFARGYERMIDLLAFCPEQRWLVHGDYTDDNILANGRQITGVVDWANAVYGDFLFDVANLDVWSPDIPVSDRVRNYYEAQGWTMTHYAERIACYLWCRRLDALRFFARTNQRAAYGMIREQVLSMLHT